MAKKQVTVDIVGKAMADREAMKIEIVDMGYPRLLNKYVGRGAVTIKATEHIPMRRGRCGDDNVREADGVFLVVASSF